MININKNKYIIILLALYLFFNVCFNKYDNFSTKFESSFMKLNIIKNTNLKIKKIEIIKDNIYALFSNGFIYKYKTPINLLKYTKLETEEQEEEEEEREEEKVIEINEDKVEENLKPEDVWIKTIYEKTINNFISDSDNNIYILTDNTIEKINLGNNENNIIVNSVNKIKDFVIYKTHILTIENDNIYIYKESKNEDKQLLINTKLIILKSIYISDNYIFFLGKKYFNDKYILFRSNFNIEILLGEQNLENNNDEEEEEEEEYEKYINISPKNFGLLEIYFLKKNIYCIDKDNFIFGTTLLENNKVEKWNEIDISTKYKNLFFYNNDILTVDNLDNIFKINLIEYESVLEKINEKQLEEKIVKEKKIIEIKKQEEIFSKNNKTLLWLVRILLLLVCSIMCSLIKMINDTEKKNNNLNLQKNKKKVKKKVKKNKKK